MYNLLHANFHRLFKDKAFYVISSLLVVWALFSVYANYLNVNTEFSINMPFLGIFTALICSLFVSKDYENGTIRNKIISGYKREEIYIANFITCAIVSFAYIVITLLFHFLITFSITDGAFGRATQIPWIFLGMLFASIAYAAVFNCFSMLLKSKTWAVIVCLSVVSLISSAMPVIVYNLSQTGNIRLHSISQFIMDFFPTGQVTQLLLGMTSHTIYMLLYSLGIIFATNIVGVLLFRRRELK